MPRQSKQPEIASTVPVAAVANLLHQLELIQAQLAHCNESFTTDSGSEKAANQETAGAALAALAALGAQGAALLKAGTLRPSSDFYVAEIEIDEVEIRIADHFGEVVYWTQQEWIDEPGLVATIANAVQEAAVAGTKDMRRRIHKQIYGYCPECGQPVIDHDGFTISQGDDKLWYHDGGCPVITEEQEEG